MQRTRPSGPRIRLAVMVASIGALLAAWLGGWYWSAAALDQQAAAQIRAWSRAGIEVDCTHRRIAGFPFRVGIFCDAASARLADDSRVSLGALRSAAQFYAPGRVVAEADGPARLEMRGSVPLVVDWAWLRASGRVGRSGGEALSVAGGVVSVRDGWAEDAPPMASLGEVQLHLRRSPERPGDIDIALSGSEIRPAGADYPGFDARLDVGLEALADTRVADFDLRQHIAQNGLAGTARRLQVAPDAGGSIVVSGPFRVDRRGVVSADLTVEFSDLSRLTEFAGSYLPEQRQLLEQIGAVVGAFSGKVPEGEADGSEAAGRQRLRLTIRDGAIAAGIVPLGRIPPLL